MYLRADQQKQQYKLYQKESQTITIDGTSAHVNVSVPQMIPNFANINMNECQEMYYQLRSFKFKNTFKNILATDKICYRINLAWTYAQESDIASLLDPTHQTMTRTASVGTINLGYANRPANPELTQTTLHDAQATADRCLTASDLVDCLNQELAKQARAYYLSQRDGNLLSTLQQNLIYFVCSSVLTYNADSGQLGLVFNNQELMQPYTAYEIIAETIDNGFLPDDDSKSYYLTGVNLELFSPPDYTEEVQARLARYIGMYSTPANITPLITTPQPLYCLNIALMREDSQLVIIQMEINASAAIQYTTAYNRLKELANNNDIFTRYFFGFTGYSGTPMNVYRYQTIYIHTSLNTNFWDQYGKRTDVMDIIPITIGQTELAIEHSHITRIYQTKDADMRTFTIRLTDENDDEIEFQDNYLLNIAVFFSNE